MSGLTIYKFETTEFAIKFVSDIIRINIFKITSDDVIEFCDIWKQTELEWMDGIICTSQYIQKLEIILNNSNQILSNLKQLLIESDPSKMTFIIHKITNQFIRSQKQNNKRYWELVKEEKQLLVKINHSIATQANYEIPITNDLCILL